MSNPWDPNANQPPGTPPPPPPQPPYPQQPPPYPQQPPAPPQQPPAPPQQPPAPQAPYPQQQPPVAQPYGAQPPGPPPGTTPPPSSAGGGKGAKIAVGGIGVLLLGGAAAFAATSLGGDSGPESPEDAVTEVLEAVDDEDVLGFLGAIDPGERDALLDNVEQIFGELERLEALDSSFEASGIDGVDLTIDFDTVEYDAEEIREGLVRVEITDGDIDYSIDPSELPVGDLVTDLQDRFGGDELSDADPEEGSTSFSELDEPLFLVARDTGGDGWRVSLGYTIAEYARVDAGEPDLDDPIEAIGEDSPEAAVEEFFRAFEGDSVDTEELIARLSPSEFGALHEYLPTFLGRDGLGVEDFDGVEFTLDEIELSSDQSGDTAVVTVDAVQVTVEETDLDETIVLEWDGECLSLDASDAPSVEEDIEDTPFGDELCAGDSIPVESFSEGVDLPEPPDFSDLEFGTYGIATARVDGEWYIAPIDTGLSAVVTTLEGLDREIIEEGIDYVEELFDAFFFGMFDSVSSGPIDFPDDGPFGDPSDINPLDDFEDMDDVFDDDGGGDGSDPADADFDSIDPDPDLDLSSGDLTDAQDLAELFASDSDQALCVYEAIVTGQVDSEELLRSYQEDPEPTPEAEDVIFDLVTLCV